MKQIGATGWNNAAWLLLALLGAAWAPALSAGERILLPNDKAKTAPVQERSAPSDPLKDWTKAGERNPFMELDLIMPPVRPIDPREQKRLKNARAEKENWMILDPGELQQKDDEKNLLGVHDYSLDDLEKGDGGDNYTFYNLKIGRAKSSEASRPNLLRLPGQRPNRDASAEAAQASQQRLAEELEDNEKRGPRSSLSVLDTRDGGTEAGAHMSRELNLKGLLDTSQSGPGSRSDATLYDFLRANSGTALTREQQVRRDNFKALLDGPLQGQAQDPINYRSDLFQERMSPVLPRPTIETPGGSLGSLPAPGAGLGGLSRPQGFGLPDASAPRMPMPGPSLPSPYLAPNDPWRASQTQPGPLGGSLFNRDGPRRGGI